MTYIGSGTFFVGNLEATLLIVFIIYPLTSDVKLLPLLSGGSVAGT